MDGERAYRTRVQWVPPGWKFKTFSTRDRGIPYDLRVDGFLSHADAEYSFIADEAQAAHPALKFRVSGGPGNLANVPVGTGTNSIYGWIFVWNTATVPNGTYQVRSVASDAAGNTFTSPIRTVVVAN